MKKIIYILAFLLFAITDQQAQDGDTGGFAFGLKGGPSIGFQKWGNYQQRDPLFASHVIGFIESLPAEGKFALFMQGGYHVRGSAIRTRARVGRNYLTGMDQEFPARTLKFKFNNVALSVGGKQIKPLSDNTSLYYLFGFRGEYTTGTNLRTYEDLNGAIGGLYYPVDDDGLGWVKKWNYGVLLGGGFEFGIAENIGIIIEASFSPDFSNQYNQPTIYDVPDPFNSGNTRTLNEQVIKNNTFEISIGFRFLRIVEYID